MTAAPLTLTTFLLARIEEDEAVARLAVEAGTTYDYFGDSSVGELASLAVGEGARQEAADFVTRHDPARVLAECAAKRAIVEYATGQHTSSAEGYDIVRILAAVYSHPDYDPSWRP